MKISPEVRDAVEHRAHGACEYCHLPQEGSVLAHPETTAIVPLFHPRRHAWSEHFTLDRDGRLRGLSPAGRVTVQLMDMNDPDRARLRSLLFRTGRWA